MVAHRGASGCRPEHTLEAYRTAIRAGADDIEVDLVVTRDGVLVARHDNELSATTDVATRPDLADRRTARVVDGRRLTGWFVEDLTFAELATVAATERFPTMRPGNRTFEGHEGVVSFTAILAMVQAESTRRGRQVGVMAELKHAAHFDRRGLPLDQLLLADLARHGLDHARSRVTVMSFETTVLRRLAARTTVPLIQLVDLPDRRPADLVAAGDDRTYRDLTWWPRRGSSSTRAWTV